MSDEPKALVKANTTKPRRPTVRREPGQHLSEPEMIAIACDLQQGISWSRIQTQHKVSRATLSKVKNKYLAQGSAELELIKKAILPQWHELTSQALSEVASRASEGALEELSIPQLVTMGAIGTDKANVIEQREGTSSVALGTFQAWGFGKKPVEDKK
ncbi:hypothetical protein LCGC14_1016240 [marine sediment metagenome]|uniref:Uncharacterized protein n=1 Tax=marine sediment metagenome TaxID=412755 RepID=A0A0F9NKD3_9ZZZZ